MNEASLKQSMGTNGRLAGLIRSVVRCSPNTFYQWLFSGWWSVRWPRGSRRLVVVCWFWWLSVRRPWRWQRQLSRRCSLRSCCSPLERYLIRYLDPLVFWLLEVIKFLNSRLTHDLTYCAPGQAKMPLDLLIRASNTLLYFLLLSPIFRLQLWEIFSLYLHTTRQFLFVSLEILKKIRRVVEARINKKFLKYKKELQLAESRLLELLL